jgi:hypothetical protein
VSKSVITLVLLQNCIVVRSGKQIEVIHVELAWISNVTEEENQEPTTLPLTGPRVGFRWAFVSTLINFQFP